MHTPGICLNILLATSFVYRVVHSSLCDVDYQPAGCYRDDGMYPRPIPHLTVTERDYSSPKWNGRLIDWRNWNDYTPQMICRCAKEAKKLGHTVFGIQFYGECWTGDKTARYWRNGESTRCIGKNYRKCEKSSYHCVGKDHANSVYIMQPDSTIQSSNTTSAA